MPLYLPVLIVVSIVCSTFALATSEKTQRFALVIGNQSYQTAPLKNALNDAKAISNTFYEMGYQVTTVTDVNVQLLREEVAGFYQRVHSVEAENKLAVVYYAGHAIQINHNNYLIPLDIDFENEQEFIAQLYDLSDLFKLMKYSKGLQSIVILDACRNNPFEIANSSMVVTQGLAPVRAPASTLIAFATEPGGVALDGRRENGVYTRHLLRFMSESISIEEVFKKVRSAVARETRNKQIPWEHSSLLQEVYFSPPKNKEVPNIVVF
ncbi:ICE-like protease p20 domain [Aliiglaciecola lipolytica E3]|uniref:ICE-like protease p20 domain n=2 Tax=Aliiglaciecola TaxID=1406885 RepID=K6WZH3_9ALTE|nr:ICE-like protease p20 domain [Aliiglaciecola lipolytica E3]